MVEDVFNIFSPEPIIDSNMSPSSRACSEENLQECWSVGTKYSDPCQTLFSTIDANPATRSAVCWYDRERVVPVTFL